MRTAALKVLTGVGLVRVGGNAVEVLPIADGGSLSFGRAGSNGVFLDSPAVSGRHCEVSMSEGVLTVSDVGSTNGTFVNGSRVSTSKSTGDAILSNGDRFVIAGIEFEVQISDADNAPAAGTDVNQTQALS